MKTVFYPFSPRIRPDWPDQFLVIINTPFNSIKKMIANKQPPSPRGSFTQLSQFRGEFRAAPAKADTKTLIKMEYQSQTESTIYVYEIDGRRIELHIPQYLQQPNEEFVKNLPNL